MTKINLKDIEHKLLKSDKVIVDYSNYIPSNGTSKKVNLKDIHNLLRSKKEIIYTTFDVSLETYNTTEEIEFMKSLLRIKAFRKSRNNKLFDLAEQKLFKHLPQHEQITLVVSLLEADIVVVIDGYTENPTRENIDQLKELIVKYKNNYDQQQKIIKHNIATKLISMR